MCNWLWGEGRPPKLKPPCPDAPSHIHGASNLTVERAHTALRLRGQTAPARWQTGNGASHKRNITTTMLTGKALRPLRQEHARACCRPVQHQLAKKNHLYGGRQCRYLPARLCELRGHCFLSTQGAALSHPRKRRRSTQTACVMEAHPTGGRWLRWHALTTAWARPRTTAAPTGQAIPKSYGDSKGMRPDGSLMHKPLPHHLSPFLCLSRSHTNTTRPARPWGTWDGDGEHGTYQICPKTQSKQTIQPTPPVAQERPHRRMAHQAVPHKEHTYSTVQYSTGHTYLWRLACQAPTTHTRHGTARHARYGIRRSACVPRRRWQGIGTPRAGAPRASSKPWRPAACRPTAPG